VSPDVPPRVSVVIPAHNEGDSILACLDRVFEAVTLPCEILVVYDSPEDTTLPYLESTPRSSPGLCPR
jgi:glycosyltransferase involved in cell wall biosynthesis